MLELDSIISFLSNEDFLFNDWGLSNVFKKKGVAVNFYGEPGTGKTMCVEAMASKFHLQIIEVNYAQIESRYVGETPKNIVAAFNKAKKANAILFFDEADSLLGSRMINVTQAADHGVNVSRAVMLKQLDDFEGLVFFCTNLAKNYDFAFVRRILFHLNFPVPDIKLRTRLWEKILPQDLPGKNKLNINTLAKLSKNFTGSDIKNAILIASSIAVQRNIKEKNLNERYRKINK